MKDGKILENIESRYFPPGIILYKSDVHKLSIDLLNLSQNSDINFIVHKITQMQPLTLNYKSKIKEILESKINYLFL